MIGVTARKDSAREPLTLRYGPFSFGSSDARCSVSRRTCLLLRSVALLVLDFRLRDFEPIASP